MAASSPITSMPPSVLSSSSSSSKSLSPLAILALALALYLAATALYRLHLSPIAHFPGPRLAALSFWYEGFYDVVLGGRYTWRIRAMHERYGPVVRINPCELHVCDKAFYHSVYVGATARRTDKWSWSARMFGTSTAMVGTTDHALHHARKSALAPYFAKAAIVRVEPLIWRKVDTLCDRLRAYRGTGGVVNLSDAFTAFSADVIGSYVFGVEFGFLEARDFAPEWREAMVELSRSTHLMKQIGCVSPVLDVIIDSWIGARLAALYKPAKFLSDIRRSTAEAIDTARRKSSTKPVKPGDTAESAKGSDAIKSVLESLLAADGHSLPESEMSTARLMDECITLLGAGSVTTAQALTLALYFILATPRIEARLRTELAKLYASTASPSWSQLSQLPYLTALLNEALRLSYGVASRLPRIAPDTELMLPADVQVDERCRVIPRGTPVSMTQMFLHDDPTIFADPLAFVPERWIAEDHAEAEECLASDRQRSPHSDGGDGRQDRPPREGNGNASEADTDDQHSKHTMQNMRRFFVPFSRGSRACLGTNLAWAEMYCCIAALFQPAAAPGTSQDSRATGIQMQLFETDEREVRVEWGLLQRRAGAGMCGRARTSHGHAALGRDSTVCNPRGTQAPA